MEMKLPQELYIVDHNPVLLVLLDLMEAYSTVDRESLIQTLG